MLDPRFTRAVAIDPGAAHAATADSLSSIGVPVTIISLGSPGHLPPAVATERLVSLVPKIHQDYVEGGFRWRQSPAGGRG
jgi:predicted dienelactone hydrolase